VVLDLYGLIRSQGSKGHTGHVGNGWGGHVAGGPQEATTTGLDEYRVTWSFTQ